MSSIGYTLEQYEALRDAIAQGVLEVKYADKEIKYRSLREMQTLLQQMRNDLGLNKKESRQKVGFSKGF